jgi:hypothetical protein
MLLEFKCPQNTPVPRNSFALACTPIAGRDTLGKVVSGKPWAIEAVRIHEASDELEPRSVYRMRKECAEAVKDIIGTGENASVALRA